VDGAGYVYVADTQNCRVQKFTSTGTFITQWGSQGSGQGQFNFPYDITVDGSGNIYVADSYNHRVQKFTSSGAFITEWGSLGSGPGQFDIPIAIAVGGEGDVYVTETNNHRVQKFTSSGAFLTQWGSLGTGPGQFEYPRGIAVGGEGYVYVTDFSNHRVQKFESTGTFLAQWGSLGTGPGHFTHPRGIAVGGEGSVYVTDYWNHRVQVFFPSFPDPDPYSGLVLNGSFETTPFLTEWTYGGELPVSLATHAAQDNYALQLGQPVSQTDQGLGEAWAHQTFYVRPEWDRPTLSFKFNMFVNDIRDYSDFFVAIQDGVGLNHLQTVLRVGYSGNTAPPAGYDMGWRSVTHDLSAYKGQHIRVVFFNRNLWPDSWGIWTYVDDVRVVEAADLPPEETPLSIFLPLILR